MADLTLVNAGVYVGKAPEATPDGREADTPKYTMPIGSLYLTATLQRSGYSVDFRDYQFNAYDDPHDPDNLADFFEGSSDILGVSCMVDFLPTTVLAVERYKRRHPDAIVILGGPGPSDCPEALVRTFPWIDIVAVGEGEVTLLELMDRLRNGGAPRLGTVAGIVFREGAQVRRTEPRARVRTLDDLPFPHPAGVDLSRYRQANVISSRGCPYECTFCDVSQLWDRRTTYRSIDSVLAEMQALWRMGFREVCFQDDNFTLNRKRVLELSEKARGRADLPRWACLGRADMVDRELLLGMKAGGCRGIFFGIESGSDHVLRDIMKGITAEAACRAVEMTADCFKEVETYFIWGFPTESAADLMKTILLMSYLQGAGAFTPIGLLSPLPKSILYARHGSGLAYDPRLAPFSLFSAIRKERNDRRVVDLIGRHKEIFPSFYTYPTPDLEEKLGLMQRFKPINALEAVRPLAASRS